jgi:CBS domain-containing protein
MDECERCGEDLTAFDGVRPKDSLERSIVKDPLERLKPHAAVKVDPETPVRAVMELLEKHSLPVLVVKGDSLLGIVTERDILFRVMGAALDPDQTPVRDIMTAEPEALAASDRIAHALNKMAVGGFRHIPVLKDGKPEAIVGVMDILSYLAEMFPKNVRNPR